MILAAHDKGRTNVLDSPRRREAAFRHFWPIARTPEH